MRAKAWWSFREALNPDQPGGSEIELPPDPEILSELTAPMLLTETRDIQVEPKANVRKRLGRSPDKADAIVMAWMPGDTAARRQTFSNGSGRPDKANLGYSAMKRG